MDLRDSLVPLIIIDEIGKMECFSRRFIGNVRLWLGGPKTLVAAIALKDEGFITQVKGRPDCRLVTITKENRDRLLNELTGEFLRKLQRGPC
ncbi:MAG: hypothetical protein NTAFB01_00490 [Nitrospira sp.]